MLEEQLERLRAQVEEVALREKSLLRRLNATLGGAGDPLLAEVRALVMQHSARRAAVRTELKALSDRIGSAPATPTLHGSPRAAPAEARLPPPAPGDWRRAMMAVAAAEHEDDVIGLL